MIAGTVLSASFVVLILCHVGLHVISAQDCTCGNTGSCDTDNICVCNGTSYTGESCTDECPDKCSTCMDEETCSECLLKYFVNTTTSSCQACAEDNCLACDESGCTTCDIGFYQIDGVCEPCADENCLGCGEDSVCEICRTGFYLNYADKTCLSCIDNCAECTNGSTCDVCNARFFVDEDYTCQPCGQFCIECESAEVCTRCDKAKYADKSSGFCLPCGKYCNDCFNPERCANCKDGSRKIAAGRKAFCTDPRNKCRRRSFYRANRKKCFPFLCLNSNQFIMKHRSKCQRWLCRQRWYQLAYPVRCATWKRRGFQEVPRYPFGSLQY